MSEPSPPPLRWQVWLVGLGDYLRTPAGAVRYFSTVEAAKQTAQEVGGIVQIQGAPPLGGFDQATS